MEPGFYEEPDFNIQLGSVKTVKDRLRDAVQRSFTSLLREDGQLFDCPIEEDYPYDARKLHEVCINHRLANHLENDVIPVLGSGEKMFVDIEFNREGVSSKTSRINGEERTLRPDIIIHNRRSGAEKVNFLIVECKKKEASREELDDDRSKIGTLMKDERYDYLFGLQVIYGKNRIKGLLFFKVDSNIESEEFEAVGVRPV